MSAPAAISGDFANRKWRHGERLKSGATSEYSTWSSMLSRCNNKNHRAYASYGGRGITVCEDWAQSYPSFLRDMGRKPSPSHSLERIDNSRGYEPGNCRWATMREQSNNRRSSQFLSAFGRSQTKAMWAREFGLSPEMLHNRLRNGWPLEEALTKPLMWKKGVSKHG